MQNNQTHEQLKIKANELFNNKCDVTTICKTLNCSTRWFYKWLKNIVVIPLVSGISKNLRNPKPVKRK